ncbi:hypothetical protein FNF31_06444 [Cafeteria roenbergensis]|uniref:EML-like first beta-propeller domain-containing protein n=4 Tax=Cafeteria roenbergensis TaxID=33653 RepID=A0A5A8CN16_CAFRO|nr:hypothetical protein FNF31_06444 [Cafeteria roenbergensis]
MEVASLLKDERVYSELALARPLLPRELRRDNVGVHAVLGAAFCKKNNLQMLGGGSHAVVVSGSLVVIIDVETLEARLLPSHDGRGIGAIAVHPAGSLLAVAERAAPSTGAPAVYLYEWPGLCVRRVLRGGTERSFAHLAFSPDGSRLATVGAAPDFLLAVWDWSSERLLLKAKAFAQDVFTVRFSQSDAGRLTTSGTGHIRFWRMAQTFTGLKLQGVIGKFGRVDLSDVTAFAEMPDGKVVSGSEAGRLLLWEGGFIKLTCAREDGGPAHDGDVGAVVLDRGSGCFVTGGEDGAVRWWPALPVEEAEGGEGGEVLPLKCMCEARVPCPAADGGGEAAARPGVVAMLRVETAAEIAATAAERGRLVAAAEQARKGKAAAPGAAAARSAAGGGAAAADAERKASDEDAKESEGDGDSEGEKKEEDEGEEKEAAAAGGKAGEEAGGAAAAAAAAAEEAAAEEAAAELLLDSRPLCGGESDAVNGECGSWLVLDSGGALWRLDVAGAPADEGEGSGWVPDGAASKWTLLLAGHGGPVRAASLCPSARFAASAGEDGLAAGRLVAAGCADGSVCALRLPDSASDFPPTSTTFELPFPYTRLALALPPRAVPKPPEEAEDDAAAGAGGPLGPASPRAGAGSPPVSPTAGGSSSPASPSRGAGGGAAVWDFEPRTAGAVSALCFSPVSPAAVAEQAAMVKGARGPAARASAMWMARERPPPRGSPEEAAGPVGCRLLLAFRGEGAGVLHEVRLPEGPATAAAAAADDGAALSAAWHTPAEEEAVAAAAARGVPVYPVPEAASVAALCTYDCSCEAAADGSAAQSEAGTDAPPSGMWAETGSVGDTVTALAVSRSGMFLVEGTSRGRVQLRSVAEPSRVLALDVLDGAGSGAVSAVAAEGDDGDGFVAAGGGDGPLVVLRAKFPAVAQAAVAAADAGTTADGPDRTRRQAEARAGVAAKGIDASRRRADAARARAAAAAKAAASAAERGKNGAPAAAGGGAGKRSSVASRGAGGGAGAAGGAATASRPDALVAPDVAEAIKAAEAEAAAAAAIASHPAPVTDDVGAGVVHPGASGAAAHTPGSGSGSGDSGGSGGASADGGALGASGAAGAASAASLPALRFEPVQAAVAALDDAATATGRSADGQGSVGGASVADITDSGVYSIQQRKLRAEADEREAAAERAKDAVRARVAELRAEFARIRQDMRAAAAEDPRRALADADLQIDPVLVERAERLRKEALEEARRRLAYRREAARIRAAKLRAAFTASVSVPLLAVRAFLRDAAVATLRAPAVDPAVAAERAAARRTRLPTLSGDGTGARGASGGANTAGLPPGSRGASGARAASAGGYGAGAGAGARLASSAEPDDDLDAPDTPFDVLMRGGRTRDEVATGGGANSFAERKRRRLARRAALAAMLDARPGEGDVDPDDEAAVANAWADLGDLKLKAAPGYVVPRAKRMDAARKRLQQLWAEEAADTVRARFNARVLALARLRSSLAGVIRRVLAAASTLAAQLESAGLAVDAHPVESLLAPRPGPDGEEVSPLDDPAACGAVPATARGAPRSGSALSAAASSAPSSAMASAKAALLKEATDADAEAELAAAEGSATVSALSAATTAQGATSARTCLLEAQRRRETLLSRVEAACDGFDAAVAQLGRERTLVAGDLGSAQLRLLTLGAEWRLLKDMGVRDSALTARLDKAELQRQRVDAQVAQAAAGIAAREAEADAWMSKQRELEAALSEAVAGHPQEAADALGRIFRRRIKRRRPGDEDDESSDSDDGFDVSQLAEMDADEDEDEEAEDVCPPGVPQALYDRVLELRGQRLDQEDALAETTKGLSELRQRLKQLRASETTMRKDVDAINREMAAFHAEKQARLNVIPVAVPLRIQQLVVGAGTAARLPDPEGPASAAGADAPVGAGGADAGAASADGASPAAPAPADGDEADADTPEDKAADEKAFAAAAAEEEAELALPAGRLPSSLGRATLLSHTVLSSQRVSLEAQLERAVALTERLAAIASERAVQDKKRRAAERTIAGVEAKAEALMQLKFGRPVDLERLDAMGSGAELAKARAHVAEAEASAADDATAADARLSASREDLVEATREGTRLLERLSELAAERQRLERALKAGGTAGLTARDDEAKEAAAAAERARLESLVGAQAAQIAEIRAEIGILSRKDGSVYGPLMAALEKSSGPTGASAAAAAGAAASGRLG